MAVMKTPRSVDLSITNRCNLRCRYCSHFESSGDTGQDLPKEQWLVFFGELNRCAVMDVCLSGGEPFLRPDLDDIVSGIVRNRMRFSMLTNGTLVTDEAAEFLASTGRCNMVQVSIDGSVPDTHDSCRGEGNFNRAIKGICSLQKYKLPVSVRVTIHKHNVEDLEGVARLLLEDFGLSGFTTNSASYMGLCRKNAGQVMLSSSERSLAMDTLLMLEQRYPGRISATAGPLAEARDWGDMETARKEGRGRMPGRGRLSGCGCTMNKLAVRADGVIVPCVQLGHIELGRINVDDFGGLWRDHPALNRLRRRNKLALDGFEFCRGCDYTDYCTGNCPALAYTVFGDEDHPSPDACLRRFIEDEGRLPLLPA